MIFFLSYLTTTVINSCRMGRFHALGCRNHVQKCRTPMYPLRGYGLNSFDFMGFRPGVPPRTPMDPYCITILLAPTYHFIISYLLRGICSNLPLLFIFFS